MRTYRLLAGVALSVVLVIVTVGVTITVTNHLNRKILLPITKDVLSGKLGQDTNSLYSYRMGVINTAKELANIREYTPSNYTKNLNEIDRELDAVNDYVKNMLNETNAISKKIEHLKSISQVPGLEKDINNIHNQIDASQPLRTYDNIKEDGLSSLSDEINKEVDQYALGHYMKHYSVSNKLDENIQVISNRIQDKKDVAELKKKLYDKGVKLSDIYDVTEAYDNELANFKQKYYLVPDMNGKNAYDELKLLSIQTDDKAYAKQLVLVNNLVNNYLSKRAKFVKKENKRILANCSASQCTPFN